MRERKTGGIQRRGSVGARRLREGERGGERERNREERRREGRG